MSVSLANLHMCTYDNPYLCCYARSEENYCKNRYPDIACLDETLVPLSVNANEEGKTSSQYINANFVDGHRQKQAFIATQGRYIGMSLHVCGDRLITQCMGCKG